MAIEITVPRLGWNMEQGVFVGWHKKDGEPVAPGEALFSLEGDKAIQEVESLDGGVLHIAPTCPAEGATIAVGTLLGYLVQPGETFVMPASGSPKSELPPKSVTTSSLPVGPTPTNPPIPSVSRPSKVAQSASPAARRLGRQLGVDVQGIAGSGPAGRVEMADIATTAAIPKPPSTRSRSDGGPAISPRAKRVAAELGVEWKVLTGSGRTGRIRERDVRAAVDSHTIARGEHFIPVSLMRRTIAERMMQSLQTTAPVTLTTTADATNLVNLREQFKAAIESVQEHVPSYTDFLVKLTAVALQAHPLMNSRWEQSRIAVSSDIHIGIAVDTDAGLLVPVLRNVPSLGLRQLAAQSRELVQRARTRKLSAHEMAGGTFTISNLGTYGIDAFTPIIVPPQCAILGVGRIARRPAVIADQIVPREQITLCLTFDHRIVDGAPAARFLDAIRRSVENPAAWLTT